MKTIIQLLKERRLISEGIEDPGILKAIFTAGGPGSGKSAISKEIFNIPSQSTLSSFGLKVVSSDVPFERMLAKYGIGQNLAVMSPEDREKIMGDGPNSLRSRAKRVYDAQFNGYKNQRLGMIIDGTGHDMARIKSIKQELESLGYDSLMIFVNTELEVALARNMARRRKIPPDVVEQRWHASQKNIGAFQSIFGPGKFVIVDNSEDTNKKISTSGDQDVQAERRSKVEVDSSVIKYITKFIRQPIQNPIGKKWIHDHEITHDLASLHKSVPDSVSDIDPVAPADDFEKAKNLFSPSQMAQ